ncbi:MAG TPA: peptidyl-prolyl cis-trans isomerase [Humisphaera sp.]
MPLIVNGQRIDDAILDTEFSQIKAYHESLGNVSCCERDPEFREMAKTNILGRVLLAQHAAKSVDPTPDADVDAALDKLMEDYGGKDWFHMRTGTTAEQLPLVRKDLDVDLRVKRMLDALAEEGPAPTDAELRAHYDANLKAFLTDEEVRASHILKNPNGEAKQEAFEALRAARAQLKAGASFDELAKQLSERAEESIDLGFFKRGELAPEFESVAFSLDVGEVSPVFVSQYGMHLITVTDRKPATPKPFAEVREEVLAHWRLQKRDRRTRELVDQLKATAAVEEIDADAEAAAAMA